MNSSDPQFRQLIKKYLSGNCTGHEKIMVESWYKSLDDNEPAELSFSEREKIEAQIWINLNKEISKKNTEVVKAWPNHNIVRYAVAACVILMICVGIYIFKMPYTIPQINNKNETTGISNVIFVENYKTSVQIVNLPDGSRITLQPKSKIHYNKNFVDDRREVTLEGEAFFNVTRNEKKPFVVYTGEITTTVLGTSFNIKAIDKQKDITVSVATGKVMVSAVHNNNLKSPSPGKNITLTPNQQAVFITSQKVFKKELVEKPAPLIAQRMIFEEKPAIEVFESFNKYYGIKIKYNDEIMKNCTVTVSFYNETFYEKLDLLCKILGATYEINGTDVIIKSDGCKN